MSTSDSASKAAAAFDRASSGSAAARIGHDPAWSPNDRSALDEAARGSVGVAAHALPAAGSAVDEVARAGAPARLDPAHALSSAAITLDSLHRVGSAHPSPGSIEAALRQAAISPAALAAGAAKPVLPDYLSGVSSAVSAFGTVSALHAAQGSVGSVLGTVSRSAIADAAQIGSLGASIQKLLPGALNAGDIGSSLPAGWALSSAAAATSATSVQDRIADILSGKDVAGTARNVFDGLSSARDIVAPGVVDRLLSKASPSGGAPCVAETKTSPPALPAPRSAAQSRAHDGETAIATVADLGRLVRAERKRLTLSQQDFGDLAGVGRRFVSELEAGKPTLEIGKVLACAAAAGIDLLAHARSPR